MLVDSPADSPRRADSEKPEFLASVFEERAENLSKHELLEWSAPTPRDDLILEKLKGPGAKLLIGPRGSGKSTLLRRAYFDLIEEGQGLGVYVNFAKSLALEPLFHTHANALQIFRQWIVMKVIVGVREAFEEMGQTLPPSLDTESRASLELIHALAKGEVPDTLSFSLAPAELLGRLESWAHDSGRNRCVLLLDDAAHVFSPEQQREFFEVFRELRSRRVSGKAAVYPGITSYSPHFHVGHEAELVEAWIRPDEGSYLATMRAIIDRRLPKRLKEALQGLDELVDLLARAAFGLPRGFLNMLSQFLGVDEIRATRPTRPAAETAVREHAESVRRVYKSLSAKLPRFKHFIEVGSELDHAIVRRLQTYNRGRPLESKAVVMAIEEPIVSELDRVLKFLVYAGVLREMEPVSRGEKGVFRRYCVHYSIMIKENGFNLGKAWAVKDILTSLSARDAHAFARGKGTTLLGERFADRCRLELPPCSKCGAARIAEEQRFCMNCGSELEDASIYEELLQAPLERLPLTPKKAEGIRHHTKLRTVQDILLDDEAQQLRKVPYIGPVWASRIRNYAEEFVSV
jgi:hypothetical protein